MKPFNDGTDKIDQLISDHFTRFMNDPDDIHEYMLSQEGDPVFADELTKNGLTKNKLPQIELTRIEHDQETKIELTLKQAFSLDAHSFKLFIYLNFVTEDHDCVQASLQILAAASGLARESCRKALRSLLNLGYVQLVKRDQKGGNVYRVIKVL